MIISFIIFLKIFAVQYETSRYKKEKNFNVIRSIKVFGEFKFFLKQFETFLAVREV